MAILHRATLSPTKLEIVTSLLDALGWGEGPVDLLGGYRYDDPDGRVGVEGLIAVRGGEAFHIPVTYREAPLEGADEHLIATLSHSALGQRWVYDAAHDPVYARQLLALVRGEVRAESSAQSDVLDERFTGEPAASWTRSVTVTGSHVLRGEQSNTSVIVDAVELGRNPNLAPAPAPWTSTRSSASR